MAVYLWIISPYFLPSMLSTEQEDSETFPGIIFPESLPAVSTLDIRSHVKFRRVKEKEAYALFLVLWKLE